MISRFAYKSFNAICDSILSGTINLIDTSDNFRFCKSERVVGSALRYLTQEKLLQREEVIIATKGGFVAQDADIGVNFDQTVKSLLTKNIIKSEDVIKEENCIEPEFISHQFENSRKRLGVETIDFYSLNLPEVHLPYMSREAFFDKLTVV